MRLADLDELIPQYAMNKQELDSYQKLCDKENAQIKKIMRGFVVQQYPAGGYVANCNVTKKEIVNEDMLIDILKKNNIPGVIKTKECIDFDALENALYKGLIPKEVILEMDKAKEVKDVVTLRVTQQKKKKGDEE